LDFRYPFYAAVEICPVPDSALRGVVCVQTIR